MEFLVKNVYGLWPYSSKLHWNPSLKASKSWSENKFLFDYLQESSKAKT